MLTKTSAPNSRELAELRVRVEQLSAEIDRLKKEVRANGSNRPKPWWHLLAGKFDDDPVFAEIVAEGRKWRESQRSPKRGNRART